MTLSNMQLAYLSADGETAASESTVAGLNPVAFPTRANQSVVVWDNTTGFCEPWGVGRRQGKVGRTELASYNANGGVGVTPGAEERGY